MQARISFQEIVDLFIDYLQIEKQRLSLTVQTYSQELKFLSKFIEEDKIDFYSLRLQDIQAYLVKRNSQQHLTGRTVSKIVSVLNSLFLFCRREEILTHNPLQFLKSAKSHNSLPSSMTIEEVDGFLEGIDSSTPLGMRDKALFELIYACGLRVHEAVNLQLPALYLDEEYVLVQGKGRKERIIPVGERAVDALRTYIVHARPRLSCLERQNFHVFLNYRGDPISRKGIWKNFKQHLGSNASSYKLHSLRHSFATHLLQSGMNLRQVQELLGHEDLSTTSIYTQISDKSLQNAHAKHHPH